MGRTKVKKEHKLEEFTLFPKLPIELRRKIWKEFSEPRLVEVHLSVFPFKGQKSWTFNSTTPVPTVLHVHHESRQFGLKWYSLHFRSNLDRVFWGLPTIYLNVKKDIVLLRHGEGSGAFGHFSCDIERLSWEEQFKSPEHQTLRLLKRVAFSADGALSNCLKETTDMIFALPNLAELFLITNEYYKMGGVDESRTSKKYDGSYFHGKKLLLDNAIRPKKVWVEAAKALDAKLQKNTNEGSGEEAPKLVISLKLLINVVKTRGKSKQG